MYEIELKNKEVIEFWNFLSNLSKDKTLGNANFKWGLVLGKGSLKPFYDALVEVDKHDEKIDEFERRRIEEVQKVAERDERGNFKTREIADPVTGRKVVEFIVDPEVQGVLDSVIDLLREEYKDVLDKYEQNQKDLLDLLEKKVTISIYPLSKDDIPVDDLSADQLYQLNRFYNLIPCTKEPKKETE